MLYWTQTKRESGDTPVTNEILELRTELNALSQQLGRRDKVAAMLKSLGDEERTLRRREEELKAALHKEEADVGRLEKTGAASVLYALLGKREEKLSDERREAAAAQLKYDAALRQLDDCLARAEVLRREQWELADAPRRYERAHEKLLELLREDPAYARRLADLERRQGENAAQLKELDESVAAGNAVMGQVEYIEQHLGSAEGWGTWDLLGGGLISDLAKHSHLDEAQEGAQRLQALLSRFRTELADVTVTARLGAVNVEGFLRFADYFFDGLIADWSVLNRIRDSRESVAEVRRQVRTALRKLSELKTARQGEKTALENEINALARHD